MEPGERLLHKFTCEDTRSERAAGVQVCNCTVLVQRVRSVWLTHQSRETGSASRTEHGCLPVQAAAEVARITGYDAPRLLSLMHLAQYLSLEAAAGLNYSTGAQAASAGLLRTLAATNCSLWSALLLFICTNDPYDMAIRFAG